MKLKILRLLLALVPILVVTAISYGQAADQGGAYVNWNPINPTPAYDTYEWTITVAQLPNVQSYYYWALQNGFVGGGTFYMGIQPYGSCGITNSGNCKIALFSFFGNGATSRSPNCAPGADGGPGEQCRIPYEWVIGHQYKLRAALTANDGTTETWTGTIADITTSSQATAIGSWGIPASAGLIGTQGISFTEYYALYSGGCGTEPFAEVIWNVPIGHNNGQAYPGTVRGTEPTTACSGNAAFTINAGSVTVQTGGSIGPFIANVQDAESARVSVVPGEWAAIYGRNLSNTTRTWNSGDFNGNSLPTTLDGVSVQFGGISAAVFFVSPNQLDVQVPAGLSGLVPVAVTVNGTVVPAALESRNYSIFSNLSLSGASPNNNGPGYCISGASTATCGPMTTRWIASPFTPSGNCTLVQVDLTLGWISGTNGAVIDLVNDQSGIPGTTALQSWTATNLPAAGPAAFITLTSTSPITFNRGTQYWLVVKGSASDILDSWSGNTFGLTGTLLSLDQGASWNNGTLNLSAFDVLGVPVPGNAAAIPVSVTVGDVSSTSGVILPVAGK